MHAEHAWNREPVHVGVEQSDFFSHSRERDGEISGDCRFPDSPFSGGDRDKSFREIDNGDRFPARRAAMAELFAKFRALFVGHHIKNDLDRLDLGDQAYAVSNILGDLLFERATGHSQGDPDRDIAAVYLHELDHIKFGQRLLQFGIIDPAKDMKYCFFSEHRVLSSAA